MKAGRFLMSKEVYDSDWEIVSGIFKIFKPFGIEYSYEDRGWWFVGTSESFDEVCIVDMVPDHMPRYDLIITSTGTSAENLTYYFRFERVVKGSQYFYDQAAIMISLTRSEVEGPSTIQVFKNRYKPD